MNEAEKKAATERAIARFHETNGAIEGDNFQNLVFAADPEVQDDLDLPSIIMRIRANLGDIKSSNILELAQQIIEAYNRNDLDSVASIGVKTTRAINQLWKEAHST